MLNNHPACEIQLNVKYNNNINLLIAIYTFYVTLILLSFCVNPLEQMSLFSNIMHSVVHEDEKSNLQFDSFSANHT